MFKIRLPSYVKTSLFFNHYVKSLNLLKAGCTNPRFIKKIHELKQFVKFPAIEYNKFEPVMRQFSSCCPSIEAQLLYSYVPAGCGNVYNYGPAGCGTFYNHGLAGCGTVYNNGPAGNGTSYNMAADCGTVYNNGPAGCGTFYNYGLADCGTLYNYGPAGCWSVYRQVLPTHLATIAG